VSLPLIRKTVRDYYLLWQGAVVFLLGFVVLFTFATHNIPQHQKTQWLKMPWVRQFISAMVGSDLLAHFSATGVASFAYAHPFTWVVLVSFILTTATGVLAGEVDRGTMDLLAGLPLSRARIYASVSFVVVGFGLPLCWIAFTGSALGRRLTGDQAVDLARLIPVAWHLYVTYVYVACFAVAVSACCSRRGTALAIAFAAIFYSFVLNFLAAIWPAVKPIAFTTFLQYFAPLPVADAGCMRWDDVAVLLTGAAAWWVFGLVAFRRRDIHAT